MFEKSLLNKIDNKLIVDNIYSIESHLFTIETTIDGYSPHQSNLIKRGNNISQNTISSNVSIFELFLFYNINNSNLLNDENKRGLICQGYAGFRKSIFDKSIVYVECNAKLHYSCFKNLKKCTTPLLIRSLEFLFYF
ncbi:hypothetical protein HZS_2170 [Henneguya salminicola]|nr:hypothetical protein HZS_2170 [Henneguya salminicola]